MRFTLLITQPSTSLVAIKALAFARALLQEGHSITRLFFFADGVENARTGTALAQDWQTFITTHDLAATVCSGSAAQRGLAITNSLLAVAGMGDWLVATLESDRLVTF